MPPKPIATKAWFHPGALEAFGEVTFYYDDAGNWDGTWTTSDDKLAQDILDKDMGVDLNFDNLPDPDLPPTLLTADDASVNSFASALIDCPKNTPQQTDLAIPAAALAVAAPESDDSYFGDTPREKHHHCFRVGSLNVNNLSPYAQGLGPKTYSTEGKDEQLCQAVCDLQVNILLLQETGVNWHKGGFNHQWKS